MYRELIPLLGDGLITTDDEYHERSRRLMLPVFHTERLAAATRVMVDEVDRSLQRWHRREQVEVYEWARELGMRVAMRALFGFNADALSATETAREFERGISFYGKDLALWLLRGPGTPTPGSAPPASGSPRFCSPRLTVVGARMRLVTTSSRC